MAIFERVNMSTGEGEFEVYVAKADFKFNCSHFIAYKGFRERLHGHNYTTAVKVVGSNTIGEDGYVIDFGDIKKAMRTLCSSTNEYFIVPMQSDALNIREDGNQLCITCEDGAFFSLPRGDCALLPLRHSSAEELAHYFWCKLVRKIGIEDLLKRQVKMVEVTVAEAPLQQATFRCALPRSEEEMVRIENSPVRMRPSPCIDSSV